MMSDVRVSIAATETKGLPSSPISEPAITIAPTVSSENDITSLS